MLKNRSQEIEIMDDLNISGTIIDKTLIELDIINTWLGGNPISLGAFRRLKKENQVQSLADLGCGSGRMMQLMSREDPTIEYTGIDANPHIIDYATTYCKDLKNIHFKCENILDPAFAKTSYDIIHCCLFLHHFSNEQLIEIFRSLYRQARVGIIVNDLHRHPLAYQSIWLITGLFSKSYMVRNDAKLSVARGFRRNELVEILREAGISNYTLNWRWAFRWQLIITKIP